MPLRTETFSGIITCVFGAAVTGFSSFGLLFVALQRAMASAGPPMAQGPNQAALTDAIQAVWLTYFPVSLLGGIAYCIAGIQLSRGSFVARRVAQALTVLGYAWLIAYAVSCYQIKGIAVLVFDTLPRSMLTIGLWISIIVGVSIGAALLTAMLYILSRPHTGRASLSGTAEAG